jgi:hypothetical protein
MLIDFMLLLRPSLSALPVSLPIDRPPRGAILLRREAFPIREYHNGHAVLRLYDKPECREDRTPSSVAPEPHGTF